MFSPFAKQGLPLNCLRSVMCMHCRVAVEAAAASPAAAHLAASCLWAQPSPQESDDPNADVNGSIGSESELARSHVASLVCIVSNSAQACWLAVSEEEKLRPTHYQALLDTFASDTLFCQDRPAGLRQIHHQNESLPAAAFCVVVIVPCSLCLAMSAVLESLQASVHNWNRLHICSHVLDITSCSPAFYSILATSLSYTCAQPIVVLSEQYYSKQRTLHQYEGLALDACSCFM